MRGTDQRPTPCAQKPNPMERSTPPQAATASGPPVLDQAGSLPTAATPKILDDLLAIHTPRLAYTRCPLIRGKGRQSPSSLVDVQNGSALLRNSRLKALAALKVKRNKQVSGRLCPTKRERPMRRMTAIGWWMVVLGLLAEAPKAQDLPYLNDRKSSPSYVAAYKSMFRGVSRLPVGFEITTEPRTGWKPLERR